MNRTVKAFAFVLAVCSVLLGVFALTGMAESSERTLYYDNYDAYEEGAKPSGLALTENVVKEALVRGAKVDGNGVLYIHRAEGNEAVGRTGPRASLALDISKYKSMKISFKAMSNGTNPGVGLYSGAAKKTTTFWSAEAKDWTEVVVEVDLGDMKYTTTVDGKAGKSGELHEIEDPAACQLRFTAGALAPGEGAYFDNLRISAIEAYDENDTTVLMDVDFESYATGARPPMDENGFDGYAGSDVARIFVEKDEDGNRVLKCYHGNPTEYDAKRAPRLEKIIVQDGFDRLHISYRVKSSGGNSSAKIGFMQAGSNTALGWTGAPYNYPDWTYIDIYADMDAGASQVYVNGKKYGNARDIAFGNQEKFALRLSAIVDTDGSWVMLDDFKVVAIRGAAVDTAATWKLENGVLTVSDNDAMCDYTAGSAPWYTRRDEIEEIVIEEGVTRIGGYAFYGCASAKKITIPSSLSSAGTNAFYGCEALDAVYITDVAKWCGIQYVNQYSHPLHYADTMYLNGRVLTNVVIPEGVTRIERWTFYSSRIQSIVLPESLESIGAMAFGYCEYLQSFHIPKNVSLIEERAFDPCSGLTSLTIDAENEHYIMEDDVLYSKDKKTLIRHAPYKLSNYYNLPEGVTGIYPGAFSGCKNLVYVRMPESVKKIGHHAFFRCTKLVQLEIPAGVQQLPTSVFNACSNLKTVTIPSSVISIGSNAFSGCSRLADVYYTGTRDAWEVIDIASGGNAVLKDVTVHCKQNVPVTALRLNRTSAVCGIGGTLRLTATVLPADATNQKVTWSSADESIATVEDGVVSGITAGTVTITATTADGGYTASCQVEVCALLPGDTNEDGVINIKDSILLAQYLAHWDVAVHMQGADCNGDGAINIKDAILLAQYLAQWDVTLGKQN